MKKIGIIVFIAALVVGVAIANILSFGNAGTHVFDFSFNDKVKGSGNPAAETRSVDSFEGVDAGGVFQVEITAAKEFSVEIEADDNLLPFIKTEVINGTLIIETKRRISTGNALRVRISAPNIERVAASGVAKITLAGLNNSALDIDAGGASKVTVNGETADLTVKASGAGKIDAENLKAEYATVNASGASRVAVFAVNHLRADASGASRITYAGNPKSAEKNSSGASSVRQN